MTVKLPTEHHLEFLSLKGAAQARLSLHLLKCHIVGNHMLWLIYACFTLENHCTGTVQSFRGGCSRRVHKIVYLAVNKGNSLVIFF